MAFSLPPPPPSPSVPPLAGLQQALSRLAVPFVSQMHSLHVVSSDAFFILHIHSPGSCGCLLPRSRFCFARWLQRRGWGLLSLQVRCKDDSDNRQQRALLGVYRSRAAAGNKKGLLSTASTDGVWHTQ